MVPDVECILIVKEILSKLNIGQFLIKVNHRQVLDGIFEVCGVPSSMFRTICSAVDKLDKVNNIPKTLFYFVKLQKLMFWMNSVLFFTNCIVITDWSKQSPWEEVRKEMVEEKNLSEEAADKIGQYVRMKGAVELVDELMKTDLGKSKDAKAGLEGIRVFLKYCDLLGCSDVVSFDLSLARGLDYYTGIIYEAVLLGIITITDFFEWYNPYFKTINTRTIWHHNLIN